MDQLRGENCSNKVADAEELISYIYHQYEGVLGVRGITLRLRQDYCWNNKQLANHPSLIATADMMGTNMKI